MAAKKKARRKKVATKKASSVRSALLGATQKSIDSAEVSFEGGEPVTIWYRPLPAKVMLNLMDVDTEDVGSIRDQMRSLAKVLTETLVEPDGKQAFASVDELTQMPFEVLWKLFNSIAGSRRAEGNA